MKYQEIIENTISYAIRNKCIGLLKSNDFQGNYKTFIDQCIENDVQSLIDFSQNKYCFGVDYIMSICEKLEIVTESDFNKARKVIHDQSNKIKIDDIHAKMSKGIISYEDGHNEIDNILSDSWEENKTVHVSDAVQEYLNHEKRQGITTGIHKFDSRNDGLIDPEMVVIAARPGVGKTAFIVQMINQICVYNNEPVGFISAEMNKRQIVERCISNATLIDNKKVTKKSYTEEEELKVKKYLDRFYSSNLHINDKTGIDIETIKLEAKKLKKKYDIKILFIDYLQLIETKKYFKTKAEKIGYISRQLKGIAKDNNIIVVPLAQLNRGSESKSVPTMSDLKDSGEIEQDADIIMILHNVDAEKLSPEQQQEVREDSCITYIDLIIAKYREGSTGYIRLRNIKNKYRFENL